MHIFLPVASSVLTLVFLLAGAVKLARSNQQLAAAGMDFAAEFKPWMVKGIGAAELLAAIGLAVPQLVGTAEMFVPLAALGVVGLMIGAVILHSRRGEAQAVFVNVTLLFLAAAVAWGSWDRLI